MQVSRFFLVAILFLIGFGESSTQAKNIDNAPLYVPSTISAATVYKQGALIIRRGSITVEAGNFDIAFNGLERGIREESIQLYLDQNVGVFSLAQGTHADRPAEQPARMQVIVSRIDSIRQELALLEADRAGYNEELTIMTTHRNFKGGEETGISVEDIRAAGKLYRERTTIVKRALVELKYQQASLNQMIG